MYLSATFGNIIIIFRADLIRDLNIILSVCFIIVLGWYVVYNKPKLRYISWIYIFYNIISIIILHTDFADSIMCTIVFLL